MRAVLDARLVLSKAREGKVHDKRQLDEEKLVDFVLDEVPIHVDLGFQGLQKEFVNIKIPDKKPRGKQLTEEQKQSNREKSSDRLFWKGGQRTARLLMLYQQILQQSEIAADESSEQMELRLSGLVVKQHGKLRVYNRIYQAIFNQAWVNQALETIGME
ncbi:transposase family protein [Scytonema sp. PCC 10023]|uniref:transposase family protein n=1 Tax=Scytonema sp. PCC 10023 TaxID=1680591 RepID=UPI0039C731FF